MNDIVFRERSGLGPGVDPHFDARVGRMLAESSDARSRVAKGSGYLELTDERPYDYLAALFEIVHAGSAPASNQFYALAEWWARVGRPRLWLHVCALRYLTTDGQTGIAVPLSDFNPKPLAQGERRRRLARTDAKEALDRLDHLTGGRLKSARQIGLTVDFDFGVAPEVMGGMLEPAALAGRSRIEHCKFGGASPVLRPLTGLIERLPGLRRFAAHQIGASIGFHPQLQRAMRELRTGNPQTAAPATAQDLPDYGLRETGRGTIVGVVDFGCDFAHPSFRKGDDGSESRILALWDQNEKPEADTFKGTPLEPPQEAGVDLNGARCRFGYGRVFEKAQIDRALKSWIGSGNEDSEQAYERLGYHPHDHHYTSVRPNSERDPFGAHGTCVLEIAAGGRRRPCALAGESVAVPSVCGVAPEADIVFVQVRLHTENDGRRLLDVNDVIDAVAYIFHVADRTGLPCAVNLSLNTMSGPHDGDGYFERRLSSLLRSGRAGPRMQGRAVVIAAGNLPGVLQGRTKRWQHLTDTVEPGRPFAFFWVSPGRDDRTRNSVEIWYDAADAWLQVTLEPTEGPKLGPVRPGQAVELLIDGHVRGSIIGSRHRPAMRDDAALEPASPPAAGDMMPGRHVILIELDPELAAQGSWRVVLETFAPGPAPSHTVAQLRFHAWLERDDEGQSGLARADPPVDIASDDLGSSIGTLSCGAEAIVVGAYDTVASQVAGTNRSGLGPGRSKGIAKPDLSAPGNAIQLIRSAHGGDAFHHCAPTGGTSMAAPFVTGTIACIYEIAPRATLKMVREALVCSSRPAPGTSSTSPPTCPPAWDSEFGYGRLNPSGTLDWIRKQPQVPEG